VKNELSAMPAFLRIAIANMIQYRAEVALWALWGIIAPLVLMAVWRAAAAASDTPGQIGARSTGELMAYFYMTMIVGHLVAAWDVYEMGWMVRTGRLSAKLLRPIAPVWQALADNIAYKIVTLGLLLPIWFAIALFVRPTFNTTSRDLLIALLALPLAAALAFVWGYVVATLAFFVTRMDAVSEVFFAAGLMLGGRIAPIDMLPAPLDIVASSLPFRWIFAYPSELLAGQLPHTGGVWSEPILGLLWQILWLILGMAVLHFCWQRGLKRYSAVGA
jgi:ABC-2 type transport system permease protein